MTEIAPPDALRVDGGLTANATFMQIQADLLGRPVMRHAAREATACGAAGTRSAVMRNIRPVTGSRVEVLAPWRVVTVCSTSNRSGASSLMTVSVPSLWELKASPVAGLKQAESTPAPMGRVARMRPSSAPRMTAAWGLRQHTKRMRLAVSMAMPAGVPPRPPRLRRPVTRRLAASTTDTLSWSSRSI